MRKSRTRRTANRRAGEVDLRASCSNGESIDRQGFGSRPVGGGRSTAQVGRVPASCSLAAPTSGSTISSLPQGSGAFPAALRRGPSAGRRPRAKVAFFQGRALARGQNVLQKRRLRRSHLRRLRVCRVLDRFLRQRDICSHLALPPVRPHAGNRRIPAAVAAGPGCVIWAVPADVPATFQRGSQALHHAYRPVRASRRRRSEKSAPGGTSLDVSTRGARGRLRHPCPFNASVYRTPRLDGRSTIRFPKKFRHASMFFWSGFAAASLALISTPASGHRTRAVQ
jgi:hypothetical protein